MATYYVAEGGEAANKAAATSGTYPGGCMSVSVHNGETFSAGDTINVVSDGGVFRLETLDIYESGTSGNEITYEFDSDCVFSGGRLISGWTVHSGSVWKATQNTEIVDLHYDGTQGAEQVSAAACTAAGHWYWASSQLYLYSSGGDPDTVYTDPGVEATETDRGSGIEVTGDYLVLNGNGTEIKYTGYHGIDSGNTDTTPSTNIIIQDFVCHDIMYGLGTTTRGIMLVDYSNAIVRRCTTHHCRSGITIFNYATGGTPTSNVVVESCLSHTNTHSCIATLAQNGNRVMSNITFRHNRTYGSAEGQGISFNNNGSNTSSTHEVYCYGNICYGHAYHGIEFYVDGNGEPFEDSVCYGNTCYGNGLVSSGGGIYAYAVGMLIKNNICAQNNQAQANYYEIRVLDGGGTQNIVDYNCCYNSSEPDLYYEDSTYYTHAEYQSFGQQTHGINTDPKFTDPGNGDFTLQSDSPCIGDGVNLGSPYNIALLPGSTWPDGVLTGDRDNY